MKCLICDGTGRLVVQREETALALQVLEEAAEEWGVKLKDLCGPRRRTHLIEARRQVAKELRDYGLSLKAIGFYLGGRHHSTILNLIDRKNRFPGGVSAGND